MKFHIGCFLAFCASYSESFTTSSARNLSLPPNRNFDRKSALVRHSTAPLKLEKTWRDTQDFNIALDKIAEQCGNSKQPVVAKAAECQEMWENQSESDAEIRPDTISFNTVLKAWNRCCNTLTESHRSHTTIPTDYNRPVDVYTPRDAAKRATSLLIEQDAPTTDVASYNIVIGKTKLD